MHVGKSFLRLMIDDILPLLPLQCVREQFTAGWKLSQEPPLLFSIYRSMISYEEPELTLIGLNSRRSVDLPGKNLWFGAPFSILLISFRNAAVAVIWINKYKESNAGFWVYSDKSCVSEILGEKIAGSWKMDVDLQPDSSRYILIKKKKTHIWSVYSSAGAQPKVIVV